MGKAYEVTAKVTAVADLLCPSADEIGDPLVHFGGYPACCTCRQFDWLWEAASTGTFPYGAFAKANYLYDLCYR